MPIITIHPPITCVSLNNSPKTIKAKNEAPTDSNKIAIEMTFAETYCKAQLNKLCPIKFGTSANNKNQSQSIEASGIKLTPLKHVYKNNVIELTM